MLRRFGVGIHLTTLPSTCVRWFQAFFNNSRRLAAPRSTLALERRRGGASSASATWRRSRPDSCLGIGIATCQQQHLIGASRSHEEVIATVVLVLDRLGGYEKRKNSDSFPPDIVLACEGPASMLRVRAPRTMGGVR